MLVTGPSPRGCEWTGLSLATGIELLCDQFPVPAKDCVWRHDRGQFQQRLAADGVGLHGKQATLVVSEQQSLPSELLQDRLDLSVLELDDLLLPLVDHATEYGEQNGPGLEQEGHIRPRKPPVSGTES